MFNKDTAICIRTIDYSETSQIVTLFARATGKIGAIAKGSKRPKSAFGGPLEIFSYGKIVFSDSTKEKLATLTEFEQQSGFSRLAGNQFALNCSLFAAELVNSMIKEYDPHPGLFDSFLQFLQSINELRLTSHEPRVTSHELALLILFQLALLKETGLQPILNACANCKTRYAPLLSAKAEKGDEIRPLAFCESRKGGRATSDEFYFSSSANGLICRDCQMNFPDRIKLTISAANCLSNVRLLAESQEKTLREIEKVLIYHFTETIGHPPKMAKHILKG